jgi:hypothetical protein
LNFSSIKSFGIQAMKLLLLTAFLLPSLVPTGFMAQRNSDTRQLEITLCPSGFSQVAIKALSRPEPATLQLRHNHHNHHNYDIMAGLGEQQAAGSGHSSHHEGVSAELCPLAAPGAIVFDIATIHYLNYIPVSIFFTAKPLEARATALLPPPVRGPPALS